MATITKKPSKTATKKTAAKPKAKPYKDAFDDDNLGDEMFILRPENFNQKLLKKHV